MSEQAGKGAEYEVYAVLAYPGHNAEALLATVDKKLDADHLAKYVSVVVSRKKGDRV